MPTRKMRAKLADKKPIVRNFMFGCESYNELGPVKRYLHLGLYDDGAVGWQLETLAPGMKECVISSGLWGPHAIGMFLSGVSFLHDQLSRPPPETIVKGMSR